MDGHGNDCPASLRDSAIIGEDRPESRQNTVFDGT